MRLAATIAGVLIFAVVFLSDSPEANAQTPQNTDKLTPVKVLELLETNSLAEELASSKKDSKKPSKEEEKYIVSEGDTLISIANTYDVSWKRIFNKNKNINNPDMLDPGITIIIPEPSEELPDRVNSLQVSEPRGYNQNTNTQAYGASVKSYRGGNTSGNTYAYGYCTWYAKNMRPDLPNQLGNAWEWVSNAQALGIPTGSEPKVGAIGQSGNHVVYVKKINGDGTITITDMNYAGLGVVTERVVHKYSHHYIY